jgi:hypothetical protein
MAITPTETPTPIPAFAPVESPELGSSEAGVDVGVVVIDAVGAEAISVDCHAIPTGIACIKGLWYTIAVVVVGVVPRTEYVMVVEPLLVLRQGSRLYQFRSFGRSVAMVKPLNMGKRMSEINLSGKYTCKFRTLDSM